ncbi:MAG TPA: glycoside hydrolase family 3 C-terminal domain-containing protein, partial [Arachnia sp.]|nr:glycoside hydrolase family 3 C-terminal domain-containing protein [Arachnia sp.]
AGNDMVMTTPGFFDGALEAIRDGLLEEPDLDAAVGRILTLKFELGLFENPRRPDRERIATAIGTATHGRLNLEAARRSLVLLRNEDGTLPLAGGYRADRSGRAADGDPAPKRIAVVGPLADDAQTQLGDWAGGSGQAGWLDGQPRDMITTVLDGLRAHAPSNWTVTHAPGAEILTHGSHPDGDYFPDGQPRPPLVVASEPDERLIADAVADAERADYVVAVVGDRIELVGEGKSTATLDLIGGQVALLDALARTGKPLIVVLLASKPLVLPASALDAAAIVWAANPGMKGGRAVSELLLGLIEPSGRLPISFARHAGQQPTYYNQIRGQHGDRYADLTQAPAFAFGEGLSYTWVEYEHLVLDEYAVPTDGVVRAELALRNVGERLVRETVQAYVSDRVTSVSWADQELKGFLQVDLAPGEEKRVALEIPVADLAIVDANGNRVVEPGEFELRVGRSSRDPWTQRATFRVIAGYAG